MSEQESRIDQGGDDSFELLSAELLKEQDTDTPVIESDVKPYPLDQDEFQAVINALPGKSTPDWKTHYLRRPEFVEEENRERLMPYDTEVVGKVNGRDAVSSTFQEEPANTALYDRIIKKVDGYDFNESVKRFVDHPVVELGTSPRDFENEKKFPTVKARQYDEEYRPGTVLTGLNANELVEVNGELRLIKSLIPGWQKNRVVEGALYDADALYELDMENVERFSLGAGREWRIRHEIGGGFRRDGSRRPPQYVIYYTFAEPTEAQRYRMRTKGVTNRQWNERGGVQKDRRVANLRIVNELFCALIRRIEGATVGDGPVDCNNPQHLKLVMGNFKKIALSTLFRSLDAETGN